MYHRLLKIYIATHEPQLEMILQGVEPEERFSHQFLCSHNVDEIDFSDYSVIILDFDTAAPKSLDRIKTIKNVKVAVIGCFTPQ